MLTFLALYIWNNEEEFQPNGQKNFEVDFQKKAQELCSVFIDSKNVYTLWYLSRGKKIPFFDSIRLHDQHTA